MTSGMQRYIASAPGACSLCRGPIRVGASVWHPTGSRLDDENAVCDACATHQPEPYYTDAAVTLWHGDALEVLRELPDSSVDAVVTDPPYGISFMGKQWDQPGQFGSTRKNGQPAVHGRERGRERALSGDTGAMDAGRYDLSPSAMRNFQGWCETWSTECLRILKPGGHLLAFGGSRTWHRLAAAVEDAGFEIRDSIAWLYGSGFPKSLDVSKAIDKLDAAQERLDRAREFQAWLAPLLTAAQVDALTGTRMGHHLTTHPTQPSVATADLFDQLRPNLPAVPDRIEELVALRSVESANFAARAVTGQHRNGTTRGEAGYRGTSEPGAGRRDRGHSPDAQTWEGWGTALKPAFEPIVVGRKPLAGTVARNVLEHGTGALNVDGCRIGDQVRVNPPGSTRPRTAMGDGWQSDAEPTTAVGRWPTNVVLDDTQAAELDRETGVRSSGTMRSGTRRQSFGGDVYGQETRKLISGDTYGDSGGASRFFPVFHYEPKAPKSERPRLWRHACECEHDAPMRPGGSCLTCGTPGVVVAHPTVKPLDLMRWLVRLVTPPGGTVLEPFAGSGTTAEACVVENLHCIAIEREADYLPLIVGRLTKPIQVGLDFDSHPTPQEDR